MSGWVLAALICLALALIVAFAWPFISILLDYLFGTGRQ